MAVSGKYNWTQLENAARRIGVSDATVKSYMKAVRERLVKAGHLEK